jgi:hypothetical protein
MTNQHEEKEHKKEVIFAPNAEIGLRGDEKVKKVG